jgi:hypothetical protein
VCIPKAVLGTDETNIATDLNRGYHLIERFIRQFKIDGFVRDPENHLGKPMEESSRVVFDDEEWYFLL